ncbi:Gfo/Idh/MocA family protein [Paenarthrobacter sp. NPDC089989]|uniref:Gfo/Idh/MocA family protein n=1 Tax=unclassified Paenarthrobacter TaxID=2634190 RepID=UPI0037F86F19
MTITSTTPESRTLRVALIGAGLMAKSHTLAYNAVPTLFPGLPFQPELSVLADADDARAEAGARHLGFARWTSNWREAVNDPDVDVVDIVTPNWLHYEIAMEAIAAGKHVYCEKPLALTAKEAKAMWEAARDAGVRTIVGFSYLGNPGVQLIKKLIDDGTLGELWSIKGHFVVDANADPSLPRTWHYERAKAGPGALGDIGSHVVSLVQMLGGPVTRVNGDLATMVKKRPEASGALSYGSKAAADAPLLPVENDDVAVVLGRLHNGASVMIEANRVGNGHPFDLGLEVFGSNGSVRFSQQDSYKVELRLRGKEPVALDGNTTLTLGPDHGDYGAFWPFPGVTLGLHELKAIEIRNLFEAVAEARQAYPSFEDGWRVTEVLEAAERSSRSGAWEAVAS